MMKKFMVLFITLMMTLAVVTPVFASGKGSGGTKGSGDKIATQTRYEQESPRNTFSIVGTIAEVGTDDVKVDVVKGNKLAQPYINTQVTLALTSTTRYLFTDGTTTTVISLADLQVGQTISANGTLAGGVWTTTRITVGASLSCLQ